ncbi:MAG TPA: hypothetical protein VK787_08260, partial [Puia sp.]|nr:hypothetical protein [Puia sp.]
RAIVLLLSIVASHSCTPTHNSAVISHSETTLFPKSYYNLLQNYLHSVLYRLGYSPTEITIVCLVKAPTITRMNYGFPEMTSF